MMELNESNLLQALQIASSGQSLRGSQEATTENQLKAWESEKGYHHLLQSAYIDTNLGLQTRWLAVILLKNGIEKYWRPTRINAITQEEKVEIRKRLFDTLNEPNNQLAIQNAHLVSKICRLDFPTNWPTLFEDIITILESCSNLNDPNSIVRLNNLAVILNQVIKILATVRIGRSRAIMQSKAPMLLPHLIKFYTILFDRWMVDESQDISSMEVGYLLLKNIRRLIVDGYVYHNRDQCIQDFMELSLQHFQKLLIINDSQHLEMMEKYIKCYVKLFHNISTENACGFILMTSSKNILLTLLSLLQRKAEFIHENDDVDSDFWEKIAIRSVLIMKTITSFTFKQSNTNIIKQRSDKLEIENAISNLKSGFFDQSLIENLFDLLLGWYLKLRPIDIENWKNDPEEWFNEELSINWEFQIRKCAENYLQDLSIYFKDFYIQYSSNKLSNISSFSDSIITQDAILSLYQLGFDSLNGNVDFSQLMNNYFIPAVLNGDQILQRRFFLILGEWIDVLNSDMRNEIYKFIIETTYNCQDLVVQLTCIQTLKIMIDDWEFRKFKFQPYCNKVIELMINLINSLHIVECKIFVLNSLSLLIERNTPLLDEKVLMDTVSIVPVLWENSNNSNEMIIKNSLLRLLKDIVNSLNNKSCLIHDIVIPLIPICCDPKSEYYSFLCEDGLELWLSCLRTVDSLSNATKLINDNFFSMLLNALINWTEILPVVLNIVKSYSILSISIFNNGLGLEIFKILAEYLKTMRDDSLFITSSVMEVCLLSGENKDIFYENLVNSGMFDEMVNYIIRDTDSPYCEIKLGIPLLRMMIDRDNMFIGRLDANSIYKLIQSYFKFLRNVTEAKIKKLILLGLLSFYKPVYVSTSFVQLSGTSDADIEYELNQLEKSVALSTVLLTNVNKVLQECLKFAEQINETTSGDLPAYHKPCTYDDEELKELDYEEEGEDPDNEYVLEMKLPPVSERVRFKSQVANNDVITHVFFKTAVSTVLQSVGSTILGVGAVDKVVIEELEILL